MILRVRARKFMSLRGRSSAILPSFPEWILKSIWKVVAQIARSAIISILYVEFLFLFLFLFLWLMRIIFRANSLSWRTFKADKNWGENFPFFKDWFLRDDIHISVIPILRRSRIYNFHPCYLTRRDTAVQNLPVIDGFSVLWNTANFCVTSPPIKIPF